MTRVGDVLEAAAYPHGSGWHVRCPACGGWHRAGALGYWVPPCWPVVCFLLVEIGDGYDPQEMAPLWVADVQRRLDEAA